MSLGLVVLEEKLFTRTPTPQSDDIKIILVREVNPVVSDRCACAQHIVGWTLSRDPHLIFGPL